MVFLKTSSRPSDRRRGFVVAAALLAVSTSVGVADTGMAAPPTSLAACASLPPENASRYVPVTPVRMALGWSENGFVAFGLEPVSTNITKVKMRNSTIYDVPDDAKAVVLNVTIRGAAGVGSVAVYSSDAAQPTGWNAYADAKGRTIANLAHVQIGSDGYVRVYRSVPTTAIAIDLVGYYQGVERTLAGNCGKVAAGRLVTLAGGGKRSLDTRTGNVPFAARTTRTVDVGRTEAGVANGLPVNARAVVITLTAINGAGGHWTAFPASLATVPGVSSLNLDGASQVRAAQAIVPLDGTTTNIKVYSASGGHLAVDVVGYFTGEADSASTDGLFVPRSAPFRMLRTNSLQTLPPWPNSTFEKNVDATVITGAPSGIGAVAVSITASEPWAAGHLTAYAAGQPRPGTSNLNLDGLFQTRAVTAITPVSSRGLAVYTISGAHINVDLMGWYLGTPTSAPNPKPDLPRYTPTKAKSVTSARFIGGSGYTRITNPTTAIGVGTNLDALANMGIAGTTPGSEYLAQAGNMILFAHRTSHGGPWRWLHQHRLNDTFYLTGMDGKRYNYRVVDIRVTSPTWSGVAAGAAGKGPITVQLVACSKSDGLPTSTSFRLVVTGRLISIT